jgi:hypothetical protein
MAASEDELAKKQVKEAVWEWAGRAAALAAVFVLGFFSAWWLYGYGPEGAPSLRERVVKQEAQIVELRNKRVDIEGQLTVTQGRLSECQQNLAKARAAQGTAPATP